MRLSCLLRFSVLAAAFCCAGVLHAATPAAFTAHYQVLRAGQPLGEAVITLKAEGGQRYRLTDQMTGSLGPAGLLAASLTQISDFRWQNSAPETLNFDYQLESAFKSKQRHIEVNWQARQVRVGGGRKSYQYPTQTGLIDPNLLPLAVGLKLRAGQQAFRLPVAVKEQVEWQEYRVVGQETIKVPAGSFQAQKIERSDDASFSAWYAPKRYPLPLKLAQQQGSDLVLQLVRFSSP